MILGNLFILPLTQFHLQTGENLNIVHHQLCNQKGQFSGRPTIISS